MSDYFADNRARWDERAPAHAQSPDYGVEQLISDPHFLSEVVRFDLPRLGTELTGLTGVHLQCHIGTDTISLSRLGATMSGLEFPGLDRTGPRHRRPGRGVDRLSGGRRLRRRGGVRGAVV